MPTRAAFSAPSTGNYTTSTSPKVTATAIPFAVGDWVVVTASSEQAGTNANVTPTASTGTFTWTLLSSSMVGAGTQSGAKMWAGQCTAATSGGGATFSLARINTGTALLWGMTATKWTGVSSIVALFTTAPTSGTASSIMQATTLAVQASSSLQIAGNDWNAVNLASRSWQVVNGAAMVESLYVFDTGNHTAYGAYVVDAGAAGTKVVGLTTPATLRWVMVGVEIRGSSVTNHNGTAAIAGTASTSAAGTVGKVGQDTIDGTGLVTAAGVVGKASGSSIAGTASVTASGVVSAGVQDGATVQGTGSVGASGVVGKSSGGTVQGTAAVTAAGTAGVRSGASIAGTAQVQASGVVATASGAAIAGVASVQATGSVVAGGGAGSAVTGTGQVAASGVVGKSSPSTVPGVGLVAASGVVGRLQGTSITGTGSVQATGVVGKQAGAAIAGTAAVTSTGDAAASGERESSAAITGTASLVAAGRVGKTSGVAVAGVVGVQTSGRVGKSTGTAIIGTATIVASGVVSTQAHVTDPDRVILVGPAERTSHSQTVNARSYTHPDHPRTSRARPDSPRHMGA